MEDAEAKNRIRTHQGLELLHGGKSVVGTWWVALLWAPAGTPAARPVRHRLSLSAGLALVEPNGKVRNSCTATWRPDTDLGLLWLLSFFLCFLWVFFFFSFGGGGGVGLRTTRSHHIALAGHGKLLASTSKCGDQRCTLPQSAPHPTFSLCVCSLRWAAPCQGANETSFPSSLFSLIAYLTQSLHCPI